MLAELKIIGCILIACSGLYTGIKILSESSTNVEHTEAIYELISAIKIKIEALCIPIPDILSEINRETLINCGYSCEELPENCEELLEKCAFKDDKPLFELFSSFVNALGKGYKKEELAKCDLSTNELQLLLKKRKDEREKRKKTVPAVCICISAGIIVLLL